ncbi:MAG: hypothetical protein KKH28_14855 [Elusimicrobia bacterium]|nr:hypothetical protein [Elusimicrobiota bacterium]
MSSKIIATVVFLGVFASYAGAEVNFDQGVDVKAAITESQNTDLVLPDASKYLGHRRYTRDCARFSFGPSENDLISEKVWLRSTEYVEECHTVMQPGPDGT